MLNPSWSQQTPFPHHFRRLVGHQALGHQEQKLKEGLSFSNAESGIAFPLRLCFGDHWVTLSFLTAYTKEMKVPVLFSLPHAAE